MDDGHGPPRLHPLLVPPDPRTSLEAFAVIDSALSSDDGSGLHTPTSVVLSLPGNPMAGNGIPPAKEVLSASLHSTPSLNNAYHNPGVPDNNPFQLRGNFQSSLDSDIPNNRRPPIPSYSSLDKHQHSLPRLSSNMHPSLPDPPPIVLPSADPQHSDMAAQLQDDKSIDQSAPPPPQSASTPALPTALASNPRTSRTSSNMVIACRQCRARKIRCDSTRPTCHNCTRRSSNCEYDAAPKRRGPDKRPGTRTRTCKKKPSEDGQPPPNKRKRLEEPTQMASKPITQPKIETATPLLIHPNVSSPLSLHSHSPVVTSSPSLSLYPAPLQQTSPAYQTTSGLNKTWPRTPDTSKLNQQTDYAPYNHTPATSFNMIPDTSFSLDRKSVPNLINPPSAQYSRKIWWDDMLNSYTPNQSQAGTLQSIVND